MSPSTALEASQTALAASLALPKCQQCGCLESTLTHFAAHLPTLPAEAVAPLVLQVTTARQHLRPIQYACLGCEHCYPAVAQNALAEAFPTFSPAADLSCEFRTRAEGWPPVVGEYYVVEPPAPVAVSTLASGPLAECLAQHKPPGLAIVGKTETENIGVEKVIKNVIANPALRYLLLAGVESKGHQTGQTFLALAENGIDAHGRVLGATGKRPLLRNVSAAEVAAFRAQVQVIDLIGCEDLGAIEARMAALAQQVPPPCGCSACGGQTPSTTATPPKLIATEPSDAVPLDKAGYFVIVPLAHQGVIYVEHYAYDNTLLRAIEGRTARALYFTLIKNGWVTELSHAAYLGKELAKAEMALQNGFKYVQEGA